jgi:hypothetical protein
MHLDRLVIAGLRAVGNDEDKVDAWLSFGANRFLGGGHRPGSLGRYGRWNV